MGEWHNRRRELRTPRSRASGIKRREGRCRVGEFDSDVRSDDARETGKRDWRAALRLCATVFLIAEGGGRPWGGGGGGGGVNCEVDVVLVLQARSARHRETAVVR